METRIFKSANVIKSLSVGDKFEYSKLIYEIRPALASCKGCSFFNEDENHCDKPASFPCSCCACNRLDNKSVVFVRVGEVHDAPSVYSSNLTSKEQEYLNEVIKDLRWTAANLEWSLSHGLVLSSTISMTQSSLSLDSSYLSKIKSFDD